jgi:hypothetical protein
MRNCGRHGKLGSVALALWLCLCLAGETQQKAGHYQVTLRLPPDGLYPQEEMQIEFRVEDSSRPDPLSGFAGVIRAAPQATIDMPQMPSMPRFTEIAHAEGTPGDYGIHPTFAHGGEFRLRLAIHPPVDEPFVVEFPLQVLDADKAARRKPLPPRFTMEVGTQPRKPKAGEPVEIRLVVRDRDNANAAVSEFETLHEALLHLVIVRRDLSQFAHEHPVAGGDGSFRLQYTFAAGGDYRLFADLAPKAAGAQILAAKLSVSGGETGGFDIRKAWNEKPGDFRVAGECKIALESPRSSLPVRKTIPVVFAIRDVRTGLPVADLQPYLGASGHLLLVHEDASTFVHSHPDENALELPAGSIRFLARFPKPGLYRGWLQIRRGGQVLTADILLQAGVDRE